VDRGRWGPREIDLDILAYADTVLESEALTLPHGGLLTRDFALLPLSEVAPEWRYPASGKYHGMRPEELLSALGLREHAGCRRAKEEW
jgi:7,8-dihydro-6-hydroxymethylpterin-pyrophosphokinase